MGTRRPLGDALWRGDERCATYAGRRVHGRQRIAGSWWHNGPGARDSWFWREAGIAATEGCTLVAVCTRVGDTAPS